ncbi:MAG TPA: histidinol-phosphate transaminase [Marinobacterium sp.]|nr:histidinol-phosphate transaminase [Marinobacterium sp.]
MSKFWSPQIHDLVPYTPGEQPKVADLTKLNTNESPYPPAPGVTAAVHQFDTDRLRLYPDPEAAELKQALAATYAVETNQVFVGNGSDEVLAHAFMAFFRQQKPLIKPSITYSFYEVYADLYGIELVNVPLTDSFEIDLERFPTENGGVIFANPNAPTGRALALERIEALLQRNTESLVLVDEAYVDFGGESAIALVDRYPNLLVTQTFSKSRSLAGLRIGFAIGHPDLIDALERVKNSFNSYPMDMLAIKAGVASLQDPAYFDECTQKIIATRENTAQQLAKLGFKVLPSATNFLFAEHRYIEGGELMGFLRTKGVLVRHFSRPEIANYLRITIGTDAEMDRLISTLKQHPDIISLPVNAE